MIKIFISTFLFSLAISSNYVDNFDRFLWIKADSMKDKESIDEALQFAFDHDFNKVFVQCRYRGDAFYKSNIVPKNNSIKNDAFDPLEYAILIGHKFNIEVHAWMNTYILWSKHGTQDAAPSNLNHIYHTNKDWTESDIYGKSDSKIDIRETQSKNWEGIYLSPNHPDVNDYLISVFKEVINKYEIDGLHLDYVRFQDDTYGYNNKGIEEFKKRHNFNPLDIERNIISVKYGWKQSEINSMKKTWQDYKIGNINSLLLDVKKMVDDKNIDLSVAVKPEPDLARDRWAQDWLSWVKLNFLDFVVLMNYYPDSAEFYIPTLLIKEDGYQGLNKIVMGISTYNQEAKEISGKIYSSYLEGFKGISLFSYNSIDEKQKKNSLWFDPIMDMFNIVK